MEELKQIIAKNRMPIFVALSALLFILVAFCPVIDILGKSTANGFKVVFDAKGLGVSRFWCALMIILPIISLVLALLPRQGKEKLPLIIYGAAFVLSLLFVMCLPQGCSMAFGSILYIILALIAAGAAFVDSSNK